MKTLAQEYAEYSRTQDSDGAVRPTVDTGFRMSKNAPSSTYTPRPNPPTKRTLDHLNAADIVTTEHTRLRGVDYITVNFDAAENRMLADIRRNIAARKAQETQLSDAARAVLEPARVTRPSLLTLVV